MTPIILKIIFLGIGATIVFDLWGQLLKYTFKVPPSNICFVGRWLLHMPAGKFTHEKISASAPNKGECIAGWAAHYMIGISLASIFIILTGQNWLQSPAVFPALVFGIITAGAPLFIMQPAFGLGFAASKTPNPWQARLRSLLNHAAFGVGLYLTALLLDLF